MNDITISGAGVIAPGEYSSIRCSGSGKISGDVKCTSIVVSGAGRADGKIDCSGKATFSGAFHCNGDFHADNCTCSGSTNFGGSVDARELTVSGATKIEGDCSTEHVKVSGGVVIGGLLNADTAEFELALPSSNRVGSIGGSKLSVKCRENSISFLNNVISMFKGGDDSRQSFVLTTSVIEEDNVDIEYVQAETVRIIDGTIGAGCHIGTLEYSGTITVDENAKIDNLVPVAAAV